MKVTGTVGVNYDVVVIGSGIGGLTAAALLAKAGKSVLVVEQHDRPGGYAHGFKRKRYIFDSGVHLTSGCGMHGYRGGQVIRKVLQATGVLEQIQFIPVNPICHAVYPGLDISFPQSIEAYVATLSKIFPKQEAGLRKLVNLCLQLAEQVAIADEMMATHDPLLIRQELAALFQYRRMTLADVCVQFIGDPKLQSVFATHWPYLGLPPSKVSFLYWAIMFIGYLVDGAFYCKGGFQSLANTLVAGLCRNKGDIRYKSAVQKIVVEKGCVQGIRLKSGESIAAETVVANADMQQTVHQLVGEQHFPASFLQKLTSMTPSMSIFAVYIATDLDMAALNIGHESFLYNDFDHDRNFGGSLNAEITWLSVTVPTLIDPELAPNGEHIIMLTTLLDFYSATSWQTAKPVILHKMLELAATYIPGLKDHLRFVEAGSPATMERYTLNQSGSAYGWEVTPEQVGHNRIGNQSPLTGLYFAGHWSSPGGGVYGVSVSGMQAAQKILNIQKQDEFWAFINKDRCEKAR
jgi:phytoene desaturase